MTRIRLHLVVALPALFLVACIAPMPIAQQGGGGDLGGTRTGGNGDVPNLSGGRGRTLPLARKVVSGKESPSTLVSSDGYRCTVTKKRFEETREGDSATCAWRQ